MEENELVQSYNEELSVTYIQKFIDKIKTV